MKKNKYIYGTIAATTAITLATVGASTVSADTQYDIFLNRVTGEWQTVNRTTGEIVKSEPNGTYSSYEEAQASLATSTVETPVTTEAPAAETTAVETPKTAADVKPALDAQQAVVDATAQDATKAQADVDAANQDVTTAQTDVDTATQAVKDAEANAANATPENIEANQADQAANLADQAANATETDEVNAEIASQTATVADAQTAVDTAQAEKDQAEANVIAKEADVKAAEDAISGTGLAEAQATLDQATKDVATATTTVDTATKAVDTAKKADAERDAKIKDAETDVKTKSDAVTTASNRVIAAQGKVASTTDTLTKANDAAKKAQDALDNVDTENININLSPELKEIYQAFLNRDASVFNKYDFYTTNQIEALAQAVTGSQNVKTAKERLSVLTSDPLILENNKAEVDYLTSIIENDSQFGESDFTLNISEDTTPVDVNNLTEEQKIEINKFAAKVITKIRQTLGVTAPEVLATSYTIKAANEQAEKYLRRGRTIHEWLTGSVENQSNAHIGHPYGLDNLSTTGAGYSPKTMSELKKHVFNTLIGFTFEDKNSNWGHALNLLRYGTKHGVAFATIKNHLHVIHFMQDSGATLVYDGNNPEPTVSYDRYEAFPDEIKQATIYEDSNNDPATLQATLAEAKATQAQAQAASDAAKAQLTKASSDYATALEAKTQAEKVLAEATATPLQTQVAENNLRLAEIALQNAEARKADAQKAVDNFSADLATKKAALDTAKAELAQAQATATAKAEALDTAKAELAKQQGTLDSLNKDKNALLAEKDRLVEEAKALAEELDGYMNAPAILANAQATLTEKQAALTEAQAKAETAQNKLETITAKLAEEKAKLAEFQAEYATVKELEDKAKDNVIATLPDGTIVAVPNTAPTAAEKPAVDIDAVKRALDKGQDVTVVDGEVVVMNPQAGVTVTQTATGEKVNYSRVERAKALPQTGAQESLLALAGVSVLSSLGLAGARRRKQG
ncbi:SEC10/PgrA surface exclusion domain-containing protein [Streptococcus suis]|uniref:SEC10/PgrA surface exclusion domain-containing protein n=1 Tax=Streptococcus suis TaxID=1307 RepID=UPI002412A222|nr:SEC10/PgrA surface exclusion domain-containing protein [Streptococcus suis]MDG4510436.1 SEC10/PgrA surface exclusion domain-containing protein [Streptococcus suis]